MHDSALLGQYLGQYLSHALSCSLSPSAYTALLDIPTGLSLPVLQTDIKRAEDSIAAMENDVKVHRDKNVVLTRELAEEQDMNAEAKTRRQSTTNSSPRNSPGGRASGMSLEDELQLSELGVAAGRSTRCNAVIAIASLVSSTNAITAVP